VEELLEALLAPRPRGALTLTTETYPLDDVSDVLSMREGEITGRAVLVPDGGERP
jgi:hypothetical protein